MVVFRQCHFIDLSSSIAASLFNKVTYLGAVGWATDRCDDAITLTASASPASTTLLRIVRCHTQSRDPR